MVCARARGRIQPTLARIFLVLLFVIGDAAGAKTQCQARRFSEVDKDRTLLIACGEHRFRVPEGWFGAIYPADAQRRYDYFVLVFLLPEFIAAAPRPNLDPAWRWDVKAGLIHLRTPFNLPFWPILQREHAWYFNEGLVDRLVYNGCVEAESAAWGQRFVCRERNAEWRLYRRNGAIAYIQEDVAQEKKCVIPMD